MRDGVSAILLKIATQGPTAERETIDVSRVNADALSVSLPRTRYETLSQGPAYFHDLPIKEK